MSGRRPWSKQTRNQEPQDNTTKQHYLVYPASQVPFCTPTPGNVWPAEQNMQIELIHCYYHQQQGHILIRRISNKKEEKDNPQNSLETFFAFFRQTMVAWGSPRAAQKKLATPPTRTPWFVGFFVISGGSGGGGIRREEKIAKINFTSLEIKCKLISLSDHTGSMFQT